MGERAQRDVFTAVFAVFLLWLLGFVYHVGALQAEEPPLPQPLGAINDYGAQLGPETRKELQALADVLKAQAQINLVLLITLLDPFSDPARLAAAIWDAWGLDPRTILLLFVREEGDWRFFAQAGSELAPTLLAPDVQDILGRVQKLTAQRRVAQAARVAMEGLARRFQPSLAENPPPLARKDQGSPRGEASWRFWIVGGLAGLGALGLALWAVQRRRCPRCGERLHRRALSAGMATFRHGRPRLRSRSDRRGWVYYCRRCGYARIASRGERGRGPQGRSPAALRGRRRL